MNRRSFLKRLFGTAAAAVAAPVALKTIQQKPEQLVLKDVSATPLQRRVIPQATSGYAQVEYHSDATSTVTFTSALPTASNSTISTVWYQLPNYGGIVPLPPKD